MARQAKGLPLLTCEVEAALYNALPSHNKKQEYIWLTSELTEQDGVRTPPKIT